ncbi:MAG: hypothetical protein DRJ42_00640 [Deltaproteobacteria bacterium]|nr:MAG: hypothetical protein DRJ42_00640 [Deltaproteobacteria bacterium]
MRADSFVTLSIVLLTLLGVPASASAWCQMTTGLTGSVRPDECDTVNTPLRWEQPCLSYTVHRDGARDFTDTEVFSIIDTSFQAWMDVRCEANPLDFQVRRRDEPASCDHAEYNTGAGNMNAIVFIEDWNTRAGYDPRAFALTTVWHNTSTGEIYDVDIEVNEELTEYTDCDALEGCDDGRTDLQNVLTHEIGHFFAMAHSDATNSTMWWMADPGDVNKRVLRTDDVTGICTIYPPGALTAACDFTERGGFSSECGGGGGGGCGCAAVGLDDAKGVTGWALGLLALVLISRRRR